MQSSDYSDVFVSYRRKDVEFVKPFTQALRDSGREIWIDWEDIPPGSVGFADDIKRGLEGADAFIAILSPDYLESTYCVDMELGYALELGKKIIPVVLKKFDTPPPQGIGHINWIYFTAHAGQANTFEESMPKVLAALDQDLEHAREHKRLQLRALEWDKNGRRNSYLLGVDELSHAEQWISLGASKTPDPTTLHAEYINSSRQLANRRQRLLLGGVSVALVIAIGLAIFSFFQYRDANKLRIEADMRADIAAQHAQVEQSQRLIGEGLPFLGYYMAIDAVSGENIPPESEHIFTSIATEPGGRLRFTRHNGSVISTVYLPDNTVFSGDNRGALYHWQADTGQVIERMSAVGTVTVMKYYPPSNLLAYGTETGDVVLMPLDTHMPIILPKYHNNRIYSLDFSADGTRLLSASKDTTLALWDTQTNQKISEVYAKGTVYQGIFVQNDQQFSAIIQSGELCTWFTENAELDSCIMVNGRSLAPGITANTVFVGTLDGAIMEFDLETGDMRRQLGSHDGAVIVLLVQPDKNRIISGANDNSVIIRSIDNGRVLHSLQAHTSPVNTLSISPVDDRLVTGSDDTTVIVWDSVRYAGTIAPQITFSESDIQTVAIDSLSGNILVAYDGESLAQIDVNGDVNKIEYLDPETQHEGTINAIDYTTDGQYVLTASSDWTVQVRNTTDYGLSYSLIDGHRGGILSAKFHPDGTKIITGGIDGNAIIWDTATQAILLELTNHTEPISDVEFSPNGNMVMTGSVDGSIILWDAPTGAVYHTLAGHVAEVLDTAFNSDGTQVVTGGRDNTLIVWDVATGEEVIRLNGHNDVINSVGFASNSIVFSASTDGTMGLWDITTGERLRTINTASPIQAATLSPDATFALILPNNGGLVRWKIDTLPDLIEWVKANRYVREPECQERLIYNIQPICTEVNLPFLRQLVTRARQGRLRSETRIFNAASQITRTFEGTDYASYQNYDAGIVSYGAYMFPLSNGSLGNVITQYIDTSNSRDAHDLKTYLDRVENRDESLRNDDNFKQLLIAAAQEDAMREAQDSVVKNAYWNRVMEGSADPRGIKTPLGRAMMFDMGIHFGVNNGFYRLAESRLGVPSQSRLGENGVSEQEFLLTVAELRRESHYRQAEEMGLPGLKERGDFWVDLILQGDWELEGDQNGELIVRNQVIQLYAR